MTATPVFPPLSMPSDYDCHRCFKVLTGKWPFMSKMIVCPSCGNKWCPRASDQRLPCSGNNEPGQPGSIYA